MTTTLWERDININESIRGHDINVDAYIAVTQRRKTIYLEAEVNGMGERIQLTPGKVCLNIPIGGPLMLGVCAKDADINNGTLRCTVEAEPCVELRFFSVCGGTRTYEIQVDVDVERLD